MLREAGYKGEKVVIINPTDFPTIGPFGQITADLLRRCGMNVDLQETDWGSLVQRRVSREPVEKGGWSIFHTWWPGISIMNPGGQRADPRRRRPRLVRLVQQPARSRR